MREKFLLTSLLILISTISYAEEKKSITKKEFLDSNIKKIEQQFDQIDTNKDQKITAVEERAYLQKIQEGRMLRAGLAKLADANKDGKITPKEEKTLLTKMDINKDGSVTFKEQKNYYLKNSPKN
jgi:Ca2+-binding EF-hand superfamily protein